MAATLHSIIHGNSKDKDSPKFNIGDVVRFVAGDLEEFGEKRVHGLPMKMKNGTALTTHEKAAKRAKYPYIQVGLVNTDLVRVVRDDNDAKFEPMTVLAKNSKRVKAESTRTAIPFPLLSPRTRCSSDPLHPYPTPCPTNSILEPSPPPAANPP